jgi:hypothetical protein
VHREAHGADKLLRVVLLGDGEGRGGLDALEGGGRLGGGELLCGVLLGGGEGTSKLHFSSSNFHSTGHESTCRSRFISAMTALLVALTTLAAPSHVDLAMVHCDAVDPLQRWSGMAVMARAGGGKLVHESSKLCLLSDGCNDDARGRLVLDDCKAGCLSGHRFAGTWSLSNDAQAPQPLAIVSSMMKKLVVDASSVHFPGDPPLVMMPWDAKKLTNQQWTVTSLGHHGPGGGAGRLLQVGKSIDGKGYLPGCPVEACCLSVKHDLVPDGDGGWSMIR